MFLGAVAATVVLAAGLVPAVAQDLTVDVVTRATELNPRTGDVAALTDGRLPDTDPAAPAFGWPTAGFLVVEWPQPVQLAKIRLYLGEMDRYAYYGYLGGTFNSTGQRIGETVPVYTREGLWPGLATGWFDIDIAATAQIDNMGIQFTGGAVIYEIQFVGPNGTLVRPSSLGLIKQELGR